MKELLCNLEVSQTSYSLPQHPGSQNKWVVCLLSVCLWPERRVLNRPGASPHRLKAANVSAEDGWWLCHRWSLLNKFELWATERSSTRVRAGVRHSDSALHRRLRALQPGVWGKGHNFSVASGISSTLLDTVGVSICLLLCRSLGSVCDNSSFFMGFKAIIRS